MDVIAERVSTIKDMSDRLYSYLSKLAQSQWSMDSRCDLWTVADVVSHLAGGAERQAASMRRGRNGNSAPPEGFSPVDSATMSANNAQRDINRRQRLGDGLLETFAQNHYKLNQLLSEFGATEWETPCWHARRGAIPARDYVDLRLQELVIHDWDIRAGLDPEAKLDVAGTRSLLPVGQIWLAMTFRSGRKTDAPVNFRFDIEGQPNASHDVVSNGEMFEIGPKLRDSADVILSCDPESYLLYVYGRLSAAGDNIPEVLRLRGDAKLIAYFEEWFKGL